MAPSEGQDILVYKLISAARARRSTVIEASNQYSQGSIINSYPESKVIRQALSVVVPVAAAVAAGLTAFEIGTDIGGSIRYPSSFCGVFGHKPSFGIVPSRGYLDHEFGGLNEADVNEVGPIARSAEDLEMLLNVMRRREVGLQASLKPAPTELKQIRDAVWFEDDFCPVERKALEVMEAAVVRLENSGIKIIHDAKPDIDPDESFEIGSALVYAAVSQSQPVSSIGEGLSHRAWLDLDAKRETVRSDWATFFEEYDAVLMPISPVSPFRHNQDGNCQTMTLISEVYLSPYGDLLKWTILTGMAYLPSTLSLIHI